MQVHPKHGLQILRGSTSCSDMKLSGTLGWGTCCWGTYYPCIHCFGTGSCSSWFATRTCWSAMNTCRSCTPAETWWRSGNSWLGSLTLSARWKGYFQYHCSNRESFEDILIFSWQCIFWPPNANLLQMLLSSSFSPIIYILMQILMFSFNLRQHQKQISKIFLTKFHIIHFKSKHWKPWFFWKSEDSKQVFQEVYVSPTHRYLAVV